MDEKPKELHLTGVWRLREVLEGLPEELQPPAPESPPGRILAAGRELLARQGLEKLSMRSVAERARVNQAMIHYYFGSKEKLVQVLVRQEILQVMRDVMGGLDSDLTGPEFFVQFPLRLLEAIRRDGDRMHLLRRILATDSERLTRAIRELGRHGIEGASQVVLELIREAQAAGLLPAMAPRSVLLFLLASAYGLVLVDPVAQVLLDFHLDDDADWREHRANLQLLIRNGLLEGPEGRADHGRP
jgi:TetR/AcrR family transcriptional regulator